MAKELPYFKFEPAEYLTKDISFCSLSAQGLFINICSYYWQRGCELSKDQLLKRLNYENELNELITEGVIDCENGIIKIKFLDSQLFEVEEKSKTNSANGSKGGRPKKNRNEIEIKPNENPIESESKGIREDKIKRDKIKEDNILIFEAEIIEYSFDDFWELYPNKVGKKTAKEKFEKLTKLEKERIEYHLPLFIQNPPFKDYTYPNPATYINQKRFEDDVQIKSIINIKHLQDEQFRKFTEEARSSNERY